MSHTKGPARDRELGMDRPITRRDFLNGIAISAVAATTPLFAASQEAFGSLPPAAQDAVNYYPPLLTGLRGSHPGSFEGAHAQRDGQSQPPATDTGEAYDLIIVGGGISGLAAAHFYRAHAPNSRILILDNHDDFGGHAKRNEFELDGHLNLMNGGTLEIDSPRPYSPVAAGLLKTLGIDVPALSKRSQELKFYQRLGLQPATFFDRETFGADKLIVGLGTERVSSPVAARYQTLLAQTPLPELARAQIAQIETAKIDYMPGLSSDEKKERLSRISYQAFLRDVARVDPAVLTYYQGRTLDEWAVGTDAVSALDCWGYGLGGFQGMNLAKGSTPRMSPTAAGYHDTGGSFHFHFPDGNATIARLLVRNLIPSAVPGYSLDDVITARVDYSQLDRPAAAMRLRLNSIVTRARHEGDPASAKRVEVTYLRGGRAYTARANGAVLACYNMMIPYLCPELPPGQKSALHQLVKAPLVYTTVALRNWLAFERLKIYRVNAPGGYHSYFQLNEHVDLGGYRSGKLPQDPILVRMLRAPCKPGLPEHEQNRAGRVELLGTSFETFERNIRDQMGRALQDGGFDPARDITGITVNRWPHGYSPEYNSLFDPDVPESQRPNVIGRARFGRITIANSDAAAAAYTDAAIDQGHRAVMELLHSLTA